MWPVVFVRRCELRAMHARKVPSGPQAQTSHQCCAHPRPGRSPPTGCGVAAHSVARAPQASAGRKHTGRGARRGVSVADSAVGRGTSNQHTGVPKGRGSPVPHSGRSDAKRVAKQPYGAQPPMLLPTVATGVVPAGPHLQVSQQGTRGRAWAFYSKKKQQSLWPLYKLRFER